MTNASVSPPLEAIKQVIETALREDAADRDRTSRLIPEYVVVRARLIARHELVIAGVPVLRTLRSHGKITLFTEDGRTVDAGGLIAELEGSAREILSLERTLLNLISRLTGIATLTSRYVRRIAAGSKVQILDTRKTTPGLRVLEKYAVRCGGGRNHRFSLADAIFLKDNHLAAADFAHYRAAIHALRPLDVPLIVEVDNLTQLDDALALDPDRVLLDNLPSPLITEASRKIRAHRSETGRAVEIEVSGGITLERVSELSLLDIDFISVGALTHSAPSADLSLEVAHA